jgi:putative phosphoribosyl transferase
MLFVDRADAGRQLARRLLHLRGTDAVVLALPRGGVPVAFEVARELQAPLDVIVVRKLGVPFQPEYAFGAIGEGGVRIVNHRVARLAGLTRQEIASVEGRERDRLNRRLGQLRGGQPPVPLAGRIAVIADDGIATGSTARAACLVARARGASRVIVAVPVGSAEAVASLRRDADEVVCLHTPVPFAAVGDWYADFSQVADAQVTGLLGQALARGPGGRDRHPAAAGRGHRVPRRPAGPGGRPAGAGPDAHAAHRGRRGPGRPGPQPAGPGAAEG